SDLTYRLERTIHNRFQETGRRLDRLIQAKYSGKAVDSAAVSDIAKELTKIQASGINFNKTVLRLVEKRKSDVYFDIKLRFTWANMDKFSTWQLVKALFVRNVNSFSVHSTTV